MMTVTGRVNLMYLLDWRAARIFPQETLAVPVEVTAERFSEDCHGCVLSVCIHMKTLPHCQRPNRPSHFPPPPNSPSLNPSFTSLHPFISPFNIPSVYPSDPSRSRHPRPWIPSIHPSPHPTPRPSYLSARWSGSAR